MELLPAASERLLGDLGPLPTAGDFVELDFRLGSCGRALDLPAVAADTPLFSRPPLAVLLKAGLEEDSEVV